MIGLGISEIVIIGIVFALMGGVVAVIVIAMGSSRGDRQN